eukprot:gene12482-biopygen921
MLSSHTFLDHFKAEITFSGQDGQGFTSDTKGLEGTEVTTSGEWMYHLAAFGSSPWDAYNEAALLWVGGRAVEARRKIESAFAAAAPDVLEALQALRARITDGSMPTLMLEEVVAARGSRPDATDATPEARPMTSADILEEYHRAEEKLALKRGESWARQRQHVADKVREKRQGKASGRIGPRNNACEVVVVLPQKIADGWMHCH